MSALILTIIIGGIGVIGLAVLVRQAPPPDSRIDRIIQERERFDPFVTGGWVKEDWVKAERHRNLKARLLASPRLGEIEELAWTNDRNGFTLYLKADNRFWTIRGGQEGIVHKITEEPYGSMRGDGGPQPWWPHYRYDVTRKEWVPVSGRWDGSTFTPDNKVGTVK